MTFRMLVIVPSRGRPHNIVRLWKAWQDTGAAADLLVVVDGDPDNVDAYRATGAPIYVQDTNLGLVGTLNRHAVANADRYEAIGFMGDDHVPRTVGWDWRICSVLADLAPVGLAYGDDLDRRRDLPTAVFMSSAIVRTLGYMAPPALWHLYCDSYWRKLGNRLGRLRRLDDVVIEHMHYRARPPGWNGGPSGGKAPKDAGYKRVNAKAQYAADGAAWRAHINSGRMRRDVHLLRALLASAEPQPQARSWMDALPGLMAQHGVQPRGVVHVGAHKGEEVSLYRRLGFARIVLVEPHPTLADELRQLAGVEVVQAACGAQTGTATLYVTEKTMQSSLLPPVRKTVQDRVTVPVRRLADITDHKVNVAVVDVQGAELDVVAGADLGRLDLVILEAHTRLRYEGQPTAQEVVDAMRGRGWRQVAEYWHDPKGKNRDYAFVPQDRP
jgi:FkbM family methyltransferase